MEKGTFRLFIAAELPENVLQVLSGLGDKIRNPQDKMTWCKPQNIHLTLKFLGDVKAEDVEPVKRTITGLTKEFPAFRISVKGLGAFPGKKEPRILWAGIEEGKDELIRLAGKLEERMYTIGFSKEDRKYKPHLTLARIKCIKDVNEFNEKLLKFNDYDAGRAEVDTVSLIKSTLTQQGPIYETICSARLMGERVNGLSS